MTYKGHIENGVIVSDEPINLPDGTLVEFQPLEPIVEDSHPDLERFAGIIQSKSKPEDDYFEYLRAKHG